MIDYKDIERVLDSKGIRFRTELWDSAYMIRCSYGVFAVGIPECIGKDYLVFGTILDSKVDILERYITGSYDDFIEYCITEHNGKQQHRQIKEGKSFFGFLNRG